VKTEQELDRLCAADLRYSAKCLQNLSHKWNLNSDLMSINQLPAVLTCQLLSPPRNRARQLNDKVQPYTPTAFIHCRQICEGHASSAEAWTLNLNQSHLTGGQGGQDSPHHHQVQPITTHDGTHMMLIISMQEATQESTQESSSATAEVQREIVRKQAHVQQLPSQLCMI